MNHPFILTHKLGWELHPDCTIRPEDMVRPRVRSDAAPPLPQFITSGVLIQHGNRKDIAYCVYCTENGLFYNQTANAIKVEMQSNQVPTDPNNNTGVVFNHNDEEEENEENDGNNGGNKYKRTSPDKPLCLLDSKKNYVSSVVCVWSQGKYAYALTVEPAVYEIELVDKAWIGEEKEKLKSSQVTQDNNNENDKKVNEDNLVPTATLVWRGKESRSAVVHLSSFSCAGAYFDRENSSVFAATTSGGFFYAIDDTSLKQLNAVKPKLQQKYLQNQSLKAFFFDEMVQSLVAIFENSALRIPYDKTPNVEETKLYSLEDIMKNRLPAGAVPFLYLFIDYLI